ncbi:MAG: Endoribonuclease YbeY [Elusimicrobia bacterium]|nr:Endoribonuclease YbeY [Elusimicrobiota bacterium]
MIISSHALLPAHIPKELRARFPRLVKKTLQSEKKKVKGEVNFIFVGRKKIRELNLQFLKESGETDVIAFPHPSGGGDVYICGPVAKDNAKRFREPYGRELVRLVIHGTLHLLGYTDWPRKDRERMWKVQERLVNLLYSKR